MRMTEQCVRGLFAVAGIPVLRLEALVDGYGYPPSDPRFYEVPPRCVWWFVKTEAGWLKIGWRHRVIAIEWSDTPIRAVVTSDDVTKSLTGVHAWSEEDAIRHLKALAIEIAALDGARAEAGQEGW